MKTILNKLTAKTAEIKTNPKLLRVEVEEGRQSKMMPQRYKNTRNKLFTWVSRFPVLEMNGFEIVRRVKKRSVTESMRKHWRKGFPCSQNIEKMRTKFWKESRAWKDIENIPFEIERVEKKARFLFLAIVEEEWEERERKRKKGK